MAQKVENWDEVFKKFEEHVTALDDVTKTNDHWEWSGRNGQQRILRSILKNQFKIQYSTNDWRAMSRHYLREFENLPPFCDHWAESKKIISAFIDKLTPVNHT